VLSGQAELKAGLVADFVKSSPPDVFSLGDLDLGGGGELAAGLARRAGVDPIFTNVRLPSFPGARRREVREVEGRRFVVLNIFGKKGLQGVGGVGAELEDPIASIDAEMADAGAGAIALICLHGVDDSDARRLANRGDFLKILVDPDHAIRFRPTSLTTRTVIVKPPDRGTEVRLLDIYLEKDAPAFYLARRFEDARKRGVPLDEEGAAARASHLVMVRDLLLNTDYPEDQAIQALIAEYKKAVRALGASAAPVESGTPYIGAEACGACHQEQLANWKTSYHAEAWATLAKDPEGGAEDPECVSCHVSGFMRPGGPARLDQIEKFKAVQCESCHAPVEGHPGGKKFARIGEALCRECHSETRDPRFDYKTYLPYATCRKKQEAGKNRVPRTNEEDGH
jgi:predicted CXXCH cytochrome family protein